MRSGPCVCARPGFQLHARSLCPSRIRVCAHTHTHTHRRAGMALYAPRYSMHSRSRVQRCLHMPHPRLKSVRVRVSRRIAHVLIHIAQRRAHSQNSTRTRTKNLLARKQLGIDVNLCNVVHHLVHVLHVTSQIDTNHRIFYGLYGTSRSRTTPTRLPCLFSSTCFSIVVLPEPKNPDTNVKGTCKEGRRVSGTRREWW